jgi:hypothetical protein
MSPTTGGTWATEDVKVCKAGLMSLSFPCSILFYEVGALNPDGVLMERGALISTSVLGHGLILLRP